MQILRGSDYQYIERKRESVDRFTTAVFEGGLNRPELYDMFRVSFTHQLQIFVLLYITTRMLAEESSSLKLVHLIYRHGDRIPVHSFPTDPHRSAWPEGSDKLTEIGMRQLFDLGKYIRHRYNHLIPRLYDPKFIYVRSTGFQRTVKSAYCKLAGLYSETSNATVESELPKLLSLNLSVFTAPPDKDLLLRIKSHCPNYDRHWSNLQQSDVWMKLEKDNKKFFELVQRHTGLTNITLMEAFSVADPVSCWISHNKSFPKWMTSDMAKRLLYIGSLKHYLKFSTPQMQRLRGGPLVKRMIRNMEMKINTSGPEAMRRMYSYSSHDGTISAIMNYLGIFNMKKSPYGSCLIIELHDMPVASKNQNYIVKIYLRNSTVLQPHPLRIPGCETNCPFQKFKLLTSKNLPVDIRKECFHSTTF